MCRREVSDVHVAEGEVRKATVLARPGPVRARGVEPPRVERRQRVLTCVVMALYSYGLYSYGPI